MRLYKTFYIFTQGSLKNSKNYYPKGLTMVGIVKLFLEKITTLETRSTQNKIRKRFTRLAARPWYLSVF